MQLKPGLRLRSQVCGAEVIVVRSPKALTELRCGGVPMVPLGTTPVQELAPVSGLDTGLQLGKRYTDAAAEGLEVMVTKAGIGTLSVGDTHLVPKEVKPLPASD